MALERLSLAPAALDAGDPENLVANGVEEGSKAPRLPRWTRQEILVLIQGKRVAENRVRRGRTAGLAFGSGQVEPKWASVSSYCKRHGVNRGPVQCRKRWSNLAGDFKKIKEWESQIKEEAESFWVMRNDLRRERKLPGFFDREVYDILDGGGTSSHVVEEEEEEGDKSLVLGLAPGPSAGGVEVVFDSGRTAAADDGLFSDVDPLSGGQQHEVVVLGSPQKDKDKEAPTASLPDPIPTSDKEQETFSQGSPHPHPHPHSYPAQGTQQDKQTSPSPETHEGRKRKRFASDTNEESSLQNQLIEAMERNGRLLTSQLQVQNTNFQLDREQRRDHANSLFAVLNKLADAMVRIADKL